MIAAMPYYLAIDAGGTSTRALLADDTSILARASTGSIKLQRVGHTEATLRLTNLLVDLALAARVSLAQIHRTCIGLAGLSIPAVRAWATDTLSTTLSGSLILLGDEEIALDAAFPNAPGILLIAGTGTNCIGRAPDGTLHRAGGYGPILGDEGGGFWIGLEALRAALRALDTAINAGPPAPANTPGFAPETGDSTHQAPGALSTSTPTKTSCHSERSEESPHFARTATQTSGAPSMTGSPSWVGSADSHPTPATDLLTSIQHHFHLANLPELIELGNRRTDPAPDFASLAPVVARAAAAGNPLAVYTLHRAANRLASLVTLVAHSFPGAPSTPPSSPWEGFDLPIAFTGSILTEIPAVHAALTARLAHTLPNARLQTTPTDPLTGALHRARHS